MTITSGTQEAVVSSGSLPLILVIDDDAGMRALLEIYLGSFGFRVVLSESGTHAMQMIAEHPDIRLVVMDVVMSGLSGLQLANEIRASRPGMAILFCSGHPAREMIRFGLDQLAEEEFVQKPCSIADLRRKVHALLACSAN